MRDAERERKRKSKDGRVDDDNEVGDAVPEGFAMVHSGVGYKLPSNSGFSRHGIPCDDEQMVIHIDAPSFITDNDVDDFCSHGAKLPERANLELMLMVSESRDQMDKKHHMRVMLGRKPVKLDENERNKSFAKNIENFDKILQAGSYNTQRRRNGAMIDDKTDPITKCKLQIAFIKLMQMQTYADASNCLLHSQSTQYIVWLLKDADEIACVKLKELVRKQFDEDLKDELTIQDVEANDADKEWDDNEESILSWKSISYASSFMYVSWMWEEMQKKHNERYARLTPANLFLVNQMQLSKVHWRLGQEDSDIVWLGMAVFVANNMAKLEIDMQRGKEKKSVPDYNKETSCGFDFSVEIMNQRQASHLQFISHHQLPDHGNTDKSRVEPLRKATPTSLEVGFVKFFGRENPKVENDLAKDYIMSEGVNADLVEAFFHQTPRDQNHDAVITTTVDPSKTNLRVQMQKRLVKGFTMYLLAHTKNNPVESHEREVRLGQLLIANYIIPASNPIDLEGLDYDHIKSRSHQVLGKSGPRLAGGAMPRLKGDTPDNAAMVDWAPLHFYAHWAASVPVAMLNKMGCVSYKIGYVTKSVVKYLNVLVVPGDTSGFAAKGTIRQFLDDETLQNLSRYMDGGKGRLVADTVVKRTMMHMLREKNIDEAVTKTTQSMMIDALPLEQLPVLFERYILRLLSYRPFLAMATVGIEMAIPTIDIDHLLLILNNREDASDDFRKSKEKLRTFIEGCWDNKRFVNMGCLEGGPAGVFGETPVPYIVSSGDDWSSADRKTRVKFNNMAGNTKKFSTDGIRDYIATNLWTSHQQVLHNTALCKTPVEFCRCIKSLTKQFDFTRFFSTTFGECELYNNFGKLCEHLGVRSGIAQKFLRVDQFPQRDALYLATLDSDVFALSINIVDAILWFAIMRRPRRDFTVMHDVAFTFTRILFNSLPTSIFSYANVPMCRLDPINKKQVIMNLDSDIRPSHIVRNTEPGTHEFECKAEFAPSGVMEDEAYMAGVIDLVRLFKLNSYQDAPLTEWPVSIHLKADMCYPLTPYNYHRKPVKKNRNVLSGDTDFFVYVHPNRKSLQFFCIDEKSQADLHENKWQDLPEDWLPQINMIHEFTTARLPEAERNRQATHFDYADQCIQQIFDMGVGPLPFSVTRPGVLIRLNPNPNANSYVVLDSSVRTRQDQIDDENAEMHFACIVPHEKGRHGCQQDTTCFLCKQNPFYDAKFEDGKVYRVRPQNAATHAIKVGTEILLSMANPQLTEIVQSGALTIEREAKRLKSKKSTIRKDANGIPINASGRSTVSRDNNTAASSYLRVKLTVSDRPSSQHGLVCVGATVIDRGNSFTQRFYVEPSDLKWPTDDDLTNAMSCINCLD